MVKKIIGQVQKGGKQFCEETNSNYVEFFDVVHGFCKPGYDKQETAKDVIVNYHAEFPVPTRLRDVFGLDSKRQSLERY